MDRLGAVAARALAALCAAIVVVGLAGCSTIKLAYNNLPEVAYWWLDGYVDFTDAQTPRARAELTALLAWHRKEELPRVIEVLQRAEALAPNDVTPAQACALVGDIRVRLMAVADRAEAPAAWLAASMEGAQIETLAKKYAANDATYRKEWLALSTRQQQDKRYDKYLEQNEDFYGALDAGQRELLQQLTARSGFDASRVNAERRKRQDDVLAMLRRFVSDAPPAADVQAALHDFVARFVEPPPGPWRDYQAAMLEEGCRNVAALHNATRPDQRQKAVQRLQAYERDLRDLAAIDRR